MHHVCSLRAGEAHGGRSAGGPEQWRSLARRGAAIRPAARSRGVRCLVVHGLADQDNVGKTEVAREYDSCRCQVGKEGAYKEGGVSIEHVPALLGILEDFVNRTEGPRRLLRVGELGKGGNFALIG